MWCDVMSCDVMWCDVMWCDVRVMWCDVMVWVSMLCQWYLTKLVGEIFLWYKYQCYVNDISRNWLVRYICGTSIHAMSMISHEINWWDISAVEVKQVIQAIQLFQVMQVRLARLWPDFRVIQVETEVGLFGPFHIARDTWQTRPGNQFRFCIYHLDKWCPSLPILQFFNFV